MPLASGFDRENASRDARVITDASDNVPAAVREAALAEVNQRAELQSHVLEVLQLRDESYLAAQREQTAILTSVSSGLDDVAASNCAVEAAINKWGARFDWQLDQVRDLLSDISGWLRTLVNYIRRTDETKSREKWEDAQNAWLDRRLNRAVELYEEALAIYDALSPASFQLGNLHFFELNNARRSRRTN